MYVDMPMVNKKKTQKNYINYCLYDQTLQKTVT